MAHEPYLNCNLDYKPGFVLLPLKHSEFLISLSTNFI
jgi:hypothetical protein